MRQRYRGTLLGLAAGDAVGTTLEFRRPGTFSFIDDMVGGGPFNLAAGEWTDDTSMALCLATSLVEKRAFDVRDQMDRYLRWHRHGYLSSNGRCFDIGNTVRGALMRFDSSGNPFSGATDPYSAGNGSIMRLAPVVLAYAADPETAIARAAESSRTTHGAREAVDGCRYLAALIIGALQGKSRAELLVARFTPVPGLWEREPLAPAIDEVASGTFRKRQPPEIVGTGYVVKSLEAALWAFAGAQNFRDGCLRAVNLGDDADTTGAVYGQLAGAYYGESGIPAPWRRQLARADMIAGLADELWQMAQGEMKE
jgi:ADP-ribosylglycohydrolase